MPRGQPVINSRRAIIVRGEVAKYFETRGNRAPYAGFVMHKRSASNGSCARYDALRSYRFIIIGKRCAQLSPRRDVVVYVIVSRK